MSAPPMENQQFQQMPAVPPSYDQAMSGQGGLPYPPQGQGMYPPLPTEKGGVPPAAAGPPVGAPGATTVVTQVQYVSAPRFGHRPVNMICPHCQASITTRTDEESGALAWIVCIGLCFVGLWPCSCIPFCMDSMKQVTHSCPSCKNTLGRYKGGL